MRRLNWHSYKYQLEDVTWQEVQDIYLPEPDVHGVLFVIIYGNYGPVIKWEGVRVIEVGIQS
jgi:hypothetical protein